MTQQDIDYACGMMISRVPQLLNEHVKKIIMYGSCSRGDYTEDSDIDIAILTDLDRIEAKKYDVDLMDTVTDIAMKTDAIVEYICIPYSEYETKKDSYGYFKNIEQEGIVLYG